jgi:putative CocE/NonD family hydrolase
MWRRSLWLWLCEEEGMMGLIDRAVARIFSLPPTQTHDVVIQRDLRIPMRDGAVLLADHYAPRAGPPRPTVLVRSPYGRRGFWGWLYGRTYAERGFQVLIESVRGTFGSGGTFEPYQHERNDGVDTLAWLRAQPWYSGEVVTAGLSYLGYVQWALAADAGPDLRAISAVVTASDFAPKTYPGGTFALGDLLNWTYTISRQEERFGGLGMLLGAHDRAVARAASRLPLRESDVALLGRHVSFFQTFLEHAPGDEWWAPVDRSGDLARVTAPVQLIGGWHDIFLPWQLRDYELLRAAGHTPHLDIGPWTHGQPASLGYALRQSLRWFRANLGDEPGAQRREPVRLFVMGAGEWREYASWPPSAARTDRWCLRPGGGLAPASASSDPPAGVLPSTYRYNPADPTPAVGGPALQASLAGAKDQRALESRADVLLFTSAPLERDLEVIGPVAADVYVRSSREHTDFFCKLCDVAPGGRSTNVCEGIVRLPTMAAMADADGVLRVPIDLWPTAYRFRRGHRIRVQIASGAHPRYARNPGTGEPLATATKLLAAEQEVFHDAAHPSAILLPVIGG